MKKAELVELLTLLKENGRMWDFDPNYHGVGCPDFIFMIEPPEENLAIVMGRVYYESPDEMTDCKQFSRAEVIWTETIPEKDKEEILSLMNA